MIIERVAEYFVDPYEVAVQLHEDYQDFIARTDNEDVEDFVRHFIEEYGFQPIVGELGIAPESYIDRVL
jgi:UDP-galactopyranose mutase